MWTFLALMLDNQHSVRYRIIAHRENFSPLSHCANVTLGV